MTDPERVEEPRPDRLPHEPCLHRVFILGWLAHCRCGRWGSYMGWESQRQAVEAWKRHRDGLIPPKEGKPWTCERLLEDQTVRGPDD